MSETSQAALMMMMIALPLMFAVIGIFILFTNLLVKALPPTEEELNN